MPNDKMPGLGTVQDLGINNPEDLQSLDRPSEIDMGRDLAIAAGSHPMKGPLSPRSAPVKTGTPLKLEADGYTRAGVDEKFSMICANPPATTDVVLGWMIATVETYVKQFVMGDRYRISYIAPNGQVKFTSDPEGPHKAQNATQILMRATD
jgi:hypothetical protein